MDKHISKIIFVDNDFIDGYKSKDPTGYRDFNNPPLDTKIIQISDKDAVSDLLNSSLVDAGQIRSGNVVVKSPCRSNHFIALSDLSEDIAVRKYDIFNAFCITLGAKRVSVAHFESNDYTASLAENIDVDIKAKTFMGELDGNFNNNKNKKTTDSVEKKVCVISEAEGGSPDLEKAKAIIMKYGLQHDSLFESLYESCELTNNRLLSKEFLIDTSKDLEKLIDSSLKARLDIVGKIYSAAGGVSSLSVGIEKNLVAFQLRVKVEF